MHASSSVMSGLGPALIGAVVAFIVVNRSLGGWPAGFGAGFRFVAWATVLIAGVMIETIAFAGTGALPVQLAGAAVGGLTRMVMESVRHGLP